MIDTFDLFFYQVRKSPKRNFKSVTFPTIYSIEQFKKVYSEMKPGETLTFEVHNSHVRMEIRDFCFLKCEVSTLTEKRCDFNEDSTIFFHFKCKGATPYNNLTWYMGYCDEEIGFDNRDAYCFCPKCDEEIYSHDMGIKYTLNKRHNIMKIRKISYIRHNNCGKNLNPENLEWTINSYHGECQDAICPYCDDVPICSQCKYPGKNYDGEFVEEDNINGFTIL